MADPEKILRHMLSDLDKHRRPRKELLSDYIQSRLDLSLKNYYEDLMKAYDAITRKDAAKIIKRVFSKEKDR